MITSRKTKLAKRVGVGAAALGAGAAGLVLAAPSASANVTSITAAPGISLGALQFGTSCSFELTASVDATTPVFFFDNGAFLGPGPITPSGGLAKYTWTPTTPGTHVLQAEQGPNFVLATTTVQVGNGINLGSACVVL